MKATAKELRTDTKRILDAVERGQDVIVTVRGKPRARIIALRPAKRARGAPGKAALFGIWKGHPDTRDVAAYVDGLRKGRF
jgi:prevent-host-death family protein